MDLACISGEEIPEHVLAISSTAIGHENQPFCWVHYAGVSVRVLNPFIPLDMNVGDSQIGLRLWEAEVCVLEWIYMHSHIIKNRRILELGAGVGLAGLSCLHLGAKHVTLTDSNSKVLENLQIISQQSPFPDQLVVRRLEWTKDFALIKAEFLTHDFLLAADCVYDPNDVAAFVETISTLLQVEPNALALIACSVRNRDTFNILLQELTKRSLSVSEQVLSEGTKKFSSNVTHMLTKSWKRENVIIFLVSVND